MPLLLLLTLTALMLPLAAVGLLQACSEAHAGRHYPGHHRLLWQPGRLWTLQAGGQQGELGLRRGQAPREVQLGGWPAQSGHLHKARQAGKEEGRRAPSTPSSTSCPKQISMLPLACSLTAGHAAGPGHPRCQQQRGQRRLGLQRRRKGPGPAGSRPKEETGV